MAEEDYRNVRRLQFEVVIKGTGSCNRSTCILKRSQQICLHVKLVKRNWKNTYKLKLKLSGISIKNLKANIWESLILLKSNLGTSGTILFVGRGRSKFSIILFTVLQLTQWWTRIKPLWFHIFTSPERSKEALDAFWGKIPSFQGSIIVYPVTFTICSKFWTFVWFTYEDKEKWLIN